MEHTYAEKLSAILSIPYTTRGNHHPDTIEFWRTVQKTIEIPNNRVKQRVTPEEYSVIRNIAWKASNRFPCDNEVAIVRTEDTLNGSDT